MAPVHLIPLSILGELSQCDKYLKSIKIRTTAELTNKGAVSLLFVESNISPQLLSSVECKQTGNLLIQRESREFIYYINQVYSVKAGILETIAPN